MTINKSKGQTLKFAGVNLGNHGFCHNQHLGNLEKTERIRKKNIKYRL